MVSISGEHLSPQLSNTNAGSGGGDRVVIYMHTMHAWLTVQMLWQMHGRTLQAVHMLIVCMGMF